MAKVTVTTKSNFAKTHIVRIRKATERQIEEMARETELVIKNEIRQRIEREGSTGNLANSFTTVKIAGGWGVGDVAFLNTNAPYWYWQNYGVAQSGRKIPPANKGSFRSGNPAPSSSGGNSRWNHSSSGQYMIRPTKAIEAKNYIAATVGRINQIISSVLRRT